MPTTQEFTAIVDQNTVYFISLVVRIFLSLVLCLAFLFGFIVAALYGSGALLIVTYRALSLVIEKTSQQHRKEKNEVLS